MLLTAKPREVRLPGFFADIRFCCCQALLVRPFLTAEKKCSTMQYRIERREERMAFSIRLTEEERLLAESYAKLHSFSLAEAFKRALFEKIEDEYDISVAESAYREYVDSGYKSTPVQDFWRELDEEV